MNDSDAMVRLADVHKTYDAPGGMKAPEVLSGVSLEVASGDTAAIVGPSGSGKSTLLNIIGSLDRPSSGKVTVAGDDLGTMDDEALARFRSRKIGFVFQLHHLLQQCTVLENVLVPTLACKTENDRRQRAESLLERVGLADRIHYRPGMLSGGERQRAAVVRALINEPQLLLADEPTGSLDKASSDSLADLLIELNHEQDLTLILVTHADDLAARMKHRYSLRDGTLSRMD